jgi:hypothetical protein
MSGGEEEVGPKDTGDIKVSADHWTIILDLFILENYFQCCFPTNKCNFLGQELGQSNNLNLLLISQLYKPYFSGDQLIIMYRIAPQGTQGVAL